MSKCVQVKFKQCKFVRAREICALHFVSAIWAIFWVYVFVCHTVYVKHILGDMVFIGLPLILIRSLTPKMGSMACCGSVWR